MTSDEKIIQGLCERIEKLENQLADLKAEWSLADDDAHSLQSQLAHESARVASLEATLAVAVAALRHLARWSADCPHDTHAEDALSEIMNLLGRNEP